jgi:hypothetical protein
VSGYPNLPERSSASSSRRTTRCAYVVVRFGRDDVDDHPTHGSASAPFAGLKCQPRRDVGAKTSASASSMSQYRYTRRPALRPDGSPINRYASSTPTAAMTATSNGFRTGRARKSDRSPKRKQRPGSFESAFLRRPLPPGWAPLSGFVSRSLLEAPAFLLLRRPTPGCGQSLARSSAQAQRKEPRRVEFAQPRREARSRQSYRCRERRRVVEHASEAEV